ncbi:tyrosine-type recombinase/integrase [uncultured Algibacter sp.]|uniref:tyrosine-type recombinase/integrase n=1 Tax=uncultured Algibacter sp. TaxID=298659 RepID=UPI003216BB6F
MKKLELENTAFKSALEQFRIRLQTQGASTDQQYIKPNLVKEFLYYMEQNDKTKLSQINQKLVNNYFEYLRNRPLETKACGMSDGYLMKHRESVLRFIEFVLGLTGVAVGKGESGIRIRLVKSKTTTKVILLEDEVKEVFNACDNMTHGIRDKAIVSLLYGCGLRRKELLMLDINDIDLNKGRIHVEESKTKYARDIPITKNVQKYIEDYLFNVRNRMLDSNSTLTSVFISERGTAISNSTLAKIMDKLNDKVNIGKKITCHLFRHSIGTHLHRFLTLQDVAQFLGHRNLDSTMIYTHLKHEYYG